jgi:hypothetical protein
MDNDARRRQLWDAMATPNGGWIVRSIEMPDAKMPDVTIDGKEAEALLAVLSRAADFCEGHDADCDLVERLKVAINKLTVDRDTAVGRAASLRNHLSDFSKGRGPSPKSAPRLRLASRHAGHLTLIHPVDRPDR